MKKIILVAFMAISAMHTKAQTNILSNNKPLGHLNPAIQNYDTDKGVVSISGVMSPRVKEEVPLAYLAIGEYKVNENFRIGLHSSRTENRLRSVSSTMLYGSYRLELEKGNYLSLGMDIGRYAYAIKSAEFNKVLRPNKFTFGTDSSSVGEAVGLDFGLGFAYAYNGFFGGLDISKMNTPSAYPFPASEYTSPRDSMIQLKDTMINYSKGDFRPELGINLMYTWSAGKNVSITHSVHAANINAAGVSYIGLQNFAEFNKRHSLGLGIFNNGVTGFIASAGFGFTENIKLEVTSFIVDDFNFNEQSRAYESNGYKPSIEANIRFEF
jgi:hypothetical protein